MFPIWDCWLGTFMVRLEAVSMFLDKKRQSTVLYCYCWEFSGYRDPFGSLCVQMPNILGLFLHFSLGLFLWAQFIWMHLIIEIVEFVLDWKIVILRMFSNCCSANVLISFSNFSFIRECLRIREGSLYYPVIRQWKN